MWNSLSPVDSMYKPGTASSSNDRGSERRGFRSIIVITHTGEGRQKGLFEGRGLP